MGDKLQKDTQILVDAFSDPTTGYVRYVCGKNPQACEKINSNVNTKMSANKPNPGFSKMKAAALGLGTLASMTAINTNQGMSNNNNDLLTLDGNVQSTAVDLVPTNNQGNPALVKNEISKWNSLGLPTTQESSAWVLPNNTTTEMTYVQNSDNPTDLPEPVIGTASPFSPIEATPPVQPFTVASATTEAVPSATQLAEPQVTQFSQPEEELTPPALPFTIATATSVPEPSESLSPERVLNLLQQTEEDDDNEMIDSPDDSSVSIVDKLRNAVMKSRLQFPSKLEDIPDAIDNAIEDAVGIDISKLVSVIQQLGSDTIQAYFNTNQTIGELLDDYLYEITRKPSGNLTTYVNELRTLEVDGIDGEGYCSAGNDLLTYAISILAVSGFVVFTARLRGSKKPILVAREATATSSDDDIKITLDCLHKTMQFQYVQEQIPFLQETEFLFQ